MGILYDVVHDEDAAMRICIDCKHYEVPHAEEPCVSCSEHYAATGEDHIYFENKEKEHV